MIGKLTALKRKSLESVKKNYWRLVSVCFLIAILTNSYAVSTTFFGFHSVKTTADSSSTDSAFIPETSNSEVVESTIDHLFSDTFLYRYLKSATSQAGKALIDLFSASISSFFTFLRVVNSLFGGLHWLSAVFLLSGAVISLLYIIYINNLLIVGEKRFFLEIQKYSQTRISKIFFLFKLRFIRNPARIMFFRTLYQSLWNLTVVGGLIKHYEYCLIPYILAENPRVGQRNAFLLSRHLTEGKKKELFLLDLSFTGWKLLSLLTLGLLDFVFVNPYMTGCKAQIYLEVRKNYILSRSPGYEYLNDPHLDKVLSEDELLINKALYDDSEGPYTKVSYFAPEQYPAFLFSVQPPIRAVRPAADPAQKYDVLSCIFLFHAFSLFGWVLEAVIHLINTGVMSQDFILFGPWLPMYGLYGVLLLLIMKQFWEKPPLVFLINVILYSVIEYMSSWIFELGLGMKLRDYSGYFLNFDGRVYLGGSVTFALVGCAFLYFLAPRWTGFFRKLSRLEQILICTVCTAAASVDLIMTGLLQSLFH